MISWLSYIERREVIMALIASLVSAPLGERAVAGTAPALSIAIPDFRGASPDELERGHDLAVAIGSDLRDSGRITPLDPGRYAGMPVNSGPVPEFGRWRGLKVECLVTGLVALQPDGRLKVEFRLWDVATGQHLDGAQYFLAPDQWHLVSRIIADAIFEKMTGQGRPAK